VDAQANLEHDLKVWAEMDELAKEIGALWPKGVSQNKRFESSDKNSRLLLVDASVWVSRFSTTEYLHAPSLNWFIHAVGSGEMIAIPALALAEISGA
jgi:hypothetical protein